jgi:hypothetical protein
VRLQAYVCHFRHRSSRGGEHQLTAQGHHVIRDGGLSDWGQGEVDDRSIARSATVEKRGTDSWIYDGDFVTTKYTYHAVCNAETLVAYGTNTCTANRTSLSDV